MEPSNQVLRQAAGGEGPCGEVVSLAVLELCAAGFTWTLNLSPERWETRHCFLGGKEFKELWLGPTLRQTKTFEKHLNWKRVGSA